VGWRAVHLDDVEAVAWRDLPLRWHPLRHALGTRVAGMAAFTTDEPGGLLIEEHRESEDGRGHEEVYVVLRGRATFTLDGETLDAPAGTFVAVEPEVTRSAVAAEAPAAVLALGGPPAYRPSASEWIERARPLIRSNPERAAAIVEELRAAVPDSPGVPIADALLAVGRGDGARAASLLAELLARKPALRAVLAEDPDLARLLP
jgi:hypothetical protein